LVVLVRNTDEEVGEINACLLSREDEAAVELGNGMCVDLIEMCFASKFEGVISEDLGESVGCLIGVVGLYQLVGGSARGIAVEVKILDALSLGIERHDAGGSPRPPMGWPRFV